MNGERQERKPIPWIWLGMGLLLTVVACITAMLLLRTFLEQAQSPSTDPIPATIIILTAPPSPTTDPGALLRPTPIPTFTPIPTPDAAIAPPEITTGFYAMVANTDGLGVTVRGGPSTRNVALAIAEEGTILLIINGPEEADGFNWWQVLMDDGTEGWAVNDFLEPAAAP